MVCSCSLFRHDWGIDAIATDPVDTDRVYVAVGMYTNDWDPNDGSILRSTDQGDTWEETKLPFKVGGNMPGRGVGEVWTMSVSCKHTLTTAATGRGPE